MYYSVDLPAGAEEPANQRPEDAGRLSILNDVSGAFRPNILTAFMGETGAGKTTLLDVLADRKTGGKIEGDIRVNVRKPSSVPCHRPSVTLLLPWASMAKVHCQNDEFVAIKFCMANRDVVAACRDTSRRPRPSPASVAT